MSTINETKQGSIQLINGRGTISYDIVSPKTNTQGEVICTVNSPMNLTKTDDINFGTLGGGGNVGTYGPKLVGPPTDIYGLLSGHWIESNSTRYVSITCQSFLGPITQPIRIKIDGISSIPNAYMDIPVQLDPITNTFKTVGSAQYALPQGFQEELTYYPVEYPELKVYARVLPTINPTAEFISHSMIITVELLENDGKATPGEALYARVNWSGGDSRLRGVINVYTLLGSNVPTYITRHQATGAYVRKDRVAASGSEIVRIPIPHDLDIAATTLTVFGSCLDSTNRQHASSVRIPLEIVRK